MTANAPWYPKHGIQPIISRLLLEIGRRVKILFFSSFFLKTPPRILKKVCLPVTLLLLPCLEFSLHLHPRLDHLHRIGEHACRRRRLHKRKNKVSEVWMGKKDWINAAASAKHKIALALLQQRTRARELSDVQPRRTRSWQRAPVPWQVASPCRTLVSSTS